MKKLHLAILAILLISLLPIFAHAEPAKNYTIKTDNSIEIEGVGDATFDVTVSEKLSRLFCASAENTAITVTHSSGETLNFGVPFPRYDLLPYEGTYTITVEHTGEPNEPQTWYLQIIDPLTDTSPQISGSNSMVYGTFHLDESASLLLKARAGEAFYDHGFVELRLYSFDETLTPTGTTTYLSAELTGADQEIQETITLAPGDYAWQVFTDGDVSYDVESAE